MSQYDLIFEGGGAKGSTFVGALTAFYEKGHQPRRLIGTSAGAITATLLAAGFTPDEMKAAVNEKLDDGSPRFASFMDKPKAGDFSQDIIDHSDTMALFKKVDVPFIPEWIQGKFDSLFMQAVMSLPLYRQLFCFVECGGLFAGDEFLVWIKEKLAFKGFGPDITLSGFNSRVTNELSLVASDTSDGGGMLVLNHRTVPDCPVAWAVRMSMSIPFVWREVVWQPQWGTYLGRSIVDHIIVDGGVLSNFPIALVDKQPAPGSYEQQVMGDTPANAAGTLGFLIDESLPVPRQPVKTSGIGLRDELKTIRRVGRLVDTMTGARDNIEIRRHENLVCRLPAAGYGTTEFDMEPARLDALIEAGYLAAMGKIP
jgi:predicted acylesterase/phospholipase RssA